MFIPSSADTGTWDIIGSYPKGFYDISLFEGNVDMANKFLHSVYYFIIFYFYFILVMSTRHFLVYFCVNLGEAAKNFFLLHGYI